MIVQSNYFGSKIILRPAQDVKSETFLNKEAGE
jgi:hypothetical protein